MVLQLCMSGRLLPVSVHEAVGVVRNVVILSIKAKEEQVYE